MSETQTGPAKPSLRDIFSAVGLAEDLDQAHIIAGAFNLYYESIRRLGRRQLLAADDVLKICQLIEVLLGAGEMEEGLRSIAGKINAQRREQS